MEDIIKEIMIPRDDYSFIGKEKDVLGCLSKINIFVGENNSGKSRFLRSIVEKDDFEFITSNKDHNKLNDFITEFKVSIKGYDHLSSFSEFEEAFNSIKTLKNFNFLIPKEDPCLPILNFLESLKPLYKMEDTSTDYASFSEWAERMKTNYDRCFQKYFGESKSIRDIKLNYSFNRIYIPILRGLRPINYGNSQIDLEKGAIYSPEYIDRDVYKFRTIADYFASNEENNGNKEKNNVFDHNIIFTGLNAYQEIRRYMLSENDEDREMIEDFEVYLSENFFGHERVKLTPAEDKDGRKKDVILVKIGKERGKPIYDLGDGIQSIIIMTLPLFLNRDKIKDNKKVLVFIEEPEHFLHPSLQRKLVETFNEERFSGFQFFFTTHSNHFLDVSLDFEGISMYTINKYLDDDNNPKFFVKNVDFGDNNLLNLLGIRNSSVFLPNCNIWVEGPTDVFYLRKYFNIYQDYMKRQDMNFIKFDEDRHYSFYEYNGSDMTNLLDLSLDTDDIRLNRLLVIRDGDTESKDEKKEVNIKLNEKLGDNFELLTCWEIENLLSKPVLLKTLENDKRYRGKLSNKDFEEEDYKNEDLKDFIKINICGDQIDWNPIGKKKKFYERVERNITEWADLSQDTIDLCGRIHDFIERNNL